jgi:hypothetical protein
MKTTWQRIYSFLGFWTYCSVQNLDADIMEERRVVYWLCFPWCFIRKFDLFSWRIRTFSLREENAMVQSLRLSQKMTPAS